MRTRFSSFWTLSVISILTLLPQSASAHVKWFVEEGAENIEPYSFTESWVIIWIVAALGILAGGLIIERKFPPRRTSRKRWSALMLRIFQVGIGAWLLINAYEGSLFAPVFEMHGTEGIVLRSVLALTGLLMMSGIFPAIASVLLAGAYITAMVLFGWMEMLEHFYVLGIAVAYWMVTSKPSQFINTYAHTALPILRISIGVSLALLAFTEKLYRPDLAHQFLMSHDWNFMRMLGLEWFDDRLFILSAGMGELIIGLLFLFGILVRFAFANLMLVFAVTAMLLGPAEVFGHLGITIAALVVAVYGGGKWTLDSLLFRRNRRRSGGKSSASADDSDE